jgi:hypothetical protein
MTLYRRNLPHWQPPGAELFLTWCLYGSYASVRHSHKHPPSAHVLPQNTAAHANSATQGDPVARANSARRQFLTQDRVPDAANSAKWNLVLHDRILDAATSAGRNFFNHDRLLDTAKSDPLWLKDERIAESLFNTFRWTSMPG